MIDHRSTVPGARMVMHLRFETAVGSRTVVIPNIELRDASAIAEAVNSVEGQFADFVDQCASLPLFPKPKAKLEVAQEPVRQNVTQMKKRGRA